MSEGFITCNTSKASSAIHGAKTNVLPSQTISNDDNEKA